MDSDPEAGTLTQYSQLEHNLDKRTKTRQTTIAVEGGPIEKD
jgi:hypothetical protein